MPDPQPTWSEANSRLYQTIAAIAVPARAEQIATLLTLLPFEQDKPFRTVELGCGEGILASALLDCYPLAEIVALDGSAEMRTEAGKRLSRFGARARIEPFELSASNWHGHLEGANCVVSSLCLHHLDGRNKQDLFAIVRQRLSPPGVFLIADLIAPRRPEARELFAATWDRAAEAQSIAETGTTELYRQFARLEWNYYRYDDPVDKPSPLFDQLLWLKDAGFDPVDCFWLQAGHAIYGGYTKVANQSGNVSFEAAVRSAQGALGK